MADSLSLKGIGLTGALQAVNNAGAPRTSDDTKDAMSFGNVLTKVSDKGPSEPVKSEKAAPKNKQEVGSEKNPDQKGKDITSGETEKTEAPGKDIRNEKISPEGNEKVKEAVEAIKEEIKEELGVSEEDIINAMETLGLAITDLLKAENIGEITAVLTENDISAVVSDESLYGSVQNIQSVQREVTGNLLQDLNLTAEEFREALSKGVFETPIEETAPEETAPEETEPFVTADPEKETFTGPENLLQPERDIRTVISNEETAGTPAETVDHSEVLRNTDRQPERSMEVTVEKAPEGSEKLPEIHMVEPKNDRSTGGNGEGRESQFTGEHGLFSTGDIRNDFMENLTEAVSQTTSDFTNTYERIQDIVNQVRDQVRISVNQETTTMEMQLNPESLGKVGLHIESRAGNVTAQFFAQDESVRAALESQVAELRRSLTEQGIKVENIEVTLASREFDSNFMNGQQGNADHPTEEEEMRTARLRRINLGAGNLEDIPEEELSEEEVLARRIMADNGGTVDFSA